MTTPKESNNIFVHKVNTLADPQWYSHSISLDPKSRLVSTSGVTAQLKDGTFPSSLSEQVSQVLANLTDALQAAGASINDIVQMRFFVVDWQPAVGATVIGPILEWLHGVKPATTLVPVPSLAFPEAKVEIEVVAAIPGSARPWTPLDGHLMKDNLESCHTAAPVETDVIVVGGGFSGLAAAYDLHKAGIKTIVLEARHRVGGRSWSRKLKSGPGVIDMGATWINRKTQPTVYALTEEFGLETFEQYTVGDEVFEGVDVPPTRAATTLGSIDGRDADSIEKTQLFTGLLFQLSESWDIRTFDQLKAEEDVSVAQWCREQQLWDNDAVKGLAKALTTALVGGEPDDVGIHYILDYIKSGHGLVSLSTEDEGGAQHLKTKGGTSAISEALAAAMPPGSIRLNSLVASIDQHGTLAIVTTTTGQVFKAAKVILANPTNTYGKIDFSPPLPPAKRAIVSRTKGGNYAKAILTYASPWWREAGLVGKFTSLKGPVCFSWELCDSAAKSFNLALFIAGDREKQWAQLPSDLARQEALVDHLAHLVSSVCGNDPAIAEKARDVIEYNAVDWTQEDWLWGAPTSYMGAGTLRSYGKNMREPFRSIHFAGGEYAYEWKGYLEGAVTSGKRAAKEVIDGLKQ